MKTETIKGYSIMLRSKADGHEFLAHGGNGLPFFTSEWKHAHNHHRELKKHELHGRVVKSEAMVRLRPNNRSQPHAEDNA